MLGLGRVYAITCLKVVILIRERLCSRLVQDPRSQVIPELRYKAKCKCGQYLVTYATPHSQKVADSFSEGTLTIILIICQTSALIIMYRQQDSCVASYSGSF